MAGLMTLTERSIGSLEDPNTPLSDGFTLLEALGGGQRTATGKRVNSNNATAHTAVYAAIQIIASTISSLPLKLYRRREDGGKEEVRAHPAWSVVRGQPNERMSAATFFDNAQGHLLTRGNTYSVIEKNGRRQTDGLVLLNPDHVEIRDRGEQLFYVLRSDGMTAVFMPNEILHVRGLGGHGMKGWSPIRRAREAIAQGMAIEEYNARFFGNNAVPDGFLRVPHSMNAEKKAQFKEDWEKAHRGLSQQHRTAVITGDISWEQTGLTAEDAQIVESLKLNWRQIAQVFNIPPHKIRDLEDATFSNISEQNIEYLQDTIRPWLVRWEQEMNRKLLTQRERNRGLFFEFVVDGLLRADPAKRADMIQTRINTGTWTINDVRRMENENPIDLPEADEPLVQMQMVPLSKISDMTPEQQVRLIEASHGVEARRKPTETRQDEPERLRLRESHRPALLDAAERVVMGEVRDIGRIAERFLPSDPETFISVVGDYYFGDDALDDLPFGLRGFPDFASQTLRAPALSYADAVMASVERELEEAGLSTAETFVDDYLPSVVNQHAARSRRQIENLELSEEPGEVVETRLSEWREGTDQGRPRAERVADEQTVRIGEAAAKAAYIAAGVLALRWRTVGDSCPYCRRLNGAVVDVRDSFVGGGETLDAEGADSPLSPATDIGHPPLHPGCDCIVRPGGF